MRQVYPEQRPVEAEEATAGLRLGDSAPPERPYLVLNMVATADGAASVGGRTRDLTDPADRELFHGLRTQADCVMVGARSARVEPYDRLVRGDRRRERRLTEGLAPDPLACFVSGALTLPSDLPLLDDPEARVVVITGSAAELRPGAASVEYLRPEPPRPGRLALAPLVGRLRSEHGVRSVLCEGGPTLNASLLAEGLVDELFLTVAPQLVGGTPETTVASGARLAKPLGLVLVSCLEAAGSLYLRYRVRR